MDCLLQTLMFFESERKIRSIPENQTLQTITSFSAFASSGPVLSLVEGPGCFYNFLEQLAGSLLSKSRCPQTQEEVEQCCRSWIFYWRTTQMHYSQMNDPISKEDVFININHNVDFFIVTYYSQKIV